MPDNHIRLVIGHPERFGLTKEGIQSVYDRHGERIGIEGEARKELLLKVISQGWMRLRRYPNRHWVVSAQSHTPATQELLWDWARKMLSGLNGFKEADWYMPVRVATLEGESHCTIGDLADGTCPR